jgi:hypothetical protein
MSKVRFGYRHGKMAAKNERAQIELFAPAAPEAPGPTVSARFEEATLRLARLIGRQIAREEFERRHQRQKAKGAAEIKKRGKSP